MNKKIARCDALVNEASFSTGLKLHQLTRSIDGVVLQNCLKQSEQAVLQQLECTIKQMQEQLQHCEQAIRTVQGKYSILSSSTDDNRCRRNKIGFTECKDSVLNSQHYDYKDAAVSQLYKQRSNDMWRRLKEYRKRAYQLSSSQSKKQNCISVQ